MNSAKRSWTLVRACIRPYCQDCEDVPMSARFKKLKKNQVRFQANDGQPIHLKGGFKDKLIYQTTWLLLLVGLGMNIKLFFDLAKPK